MKWNAGRFITKSFLTFPVVDSNFSIKRLVFYALQDSSKTFFCKNHKHVKSVVLQMMWSELYFLVKDCTNFPEQHVWLR